MPKQNSITVELCGKLVSDYVELAEKPAVIVSSVVLLIYLASWWLDMSYYNLIIPLVFLAQVLTAVGVAYWRGVMRFDSWPQVAILTIMIGAAAGVISSLMALIRFGHFWLIFNIIAEPVWSGLLAMIISLLTLGFFSLPRLLSSFRAKIKK